MPDRLSPRRVSRVLAVAVLALTLVACGGDDDDAGSGGDTSTTEASSASSDESELDSEDPSESEDPGETESEDPAEAEGCTGPGDTTGSSSESAAGSCATSLGDPYLGHTSEVYEDEAAWICRPDLADDACRDLDVTVLAPDGSRTVEEREPMADPPVDCFYVYPTVSNDPGTNSDMEVSPDDAETLTVMAQAAQYARSCRVFAPIYRQVTLQGLGSGGFAEGGAVAYADVVDAWKTYVSQFSEGRGVILIGHSQGAGVLSRLIAEEIDDKPDVRTRLVSAHLFGTAVQAPEGELVGGTFDEVPACTKAVDTGCVVTWSSYPADAPPVEGAIFGRAGDDGQRALCVDAVGLLDREHAATVAPVRAPLVGGVPGAEGVDTSYIAIPDAVDVACDATEGHDYLAVSLVDDADPRPVETLVEQRLGPTWGLHLYDVTLAYDDLVELAIRQGSAYAG